MSSFISLKTDDTTQKTYHNLILQLNKELQLEIELSVDKDELMRLVDSWVDYYLEKNMTTLMQTLYRVDVSEEKLKRALQSEHPSNDISLLILDRLLLKVIIREAYQSGNNLNQITE